MTEDPISFAIEAIRSDRIKTRSEGLDTLKHQFQLSQSGSVIELLKDKSYHNIFEAIFASASKEKENYKKTNKSASSSSISNRLNECSKVLRLAIQAGATKIKPKTLRTLLDHLIQGILLKDGTFCEPLTLEYFRALHHLLDYAPHVEHLSKPEWSKLVDFCLEGIRLYQDGGSQDASFSSVDPGPISEHNSFAVSKAAVTNGRSLAIRHASTEPKQLLEELFACLECLVLSPSADLARRFSDIATPLIDFLQGHKNPGQAHLSVFASINHLLAEAAIGHIDQAKKFVLLLLPVLNQLWVSRLVALKDEIMVTWIHMSTFIEALVIRDRSEDCIIMLENLYATIRREYQSRPERDQLQLDDLFFCNTEDETFGVTPFQLSTVMLGVPSRRAEQCWMSLDIMSTIIFLLDTHTKAARREDEGSRRTKRSKTNSHLEEVISELKSTNSSIKRSSLQVLLFSCMNYPYDLSSAQKAMEGLYDTMTDAKSDAVSWSVISLTSFSCLQLPVLTSPFQAFWTQAWRVASRAITVKSTCRAACHFLTALASTEACDQSVVMEQVNAMFSYIDLNGPASFSDSSVSLWICLMRLRAKDFLGGLDQSSERLLQWLFARWQPSKTGDRNALLSPSYFQHMIPTVIDLILICAGENQYTPPRTLSLPICGSVGQALISQSQTHSLQTYLLLVPKRTSISTRFRDHAQSAEKGSKISSAQDKPYIIMSIGFLSSEFSKLQQTFAAETHEVSQKMTPEVVQHIMQMCVIFAVLSPRMSKDSPTRFSELRYIFESLVEILVKNMPRIDPEAILLQPLLEAVEEFLPNPWLESNNPDLTIHLPLFDLCNRILPVLISDGAPDSKSRQDTISDDMELDDFESQLSRKTDIQSKTIDYPRQEIAAMSSKITFRACVINHIHLLSSISSSVQEPNSDHGVPTAFFEHVTTLSTHELISCRQLLQSLSILKNSPRRDDTFRLLLQASGILQSYEHERSDVAILLCIELLTQIEPNIMDASFNDELSDICSALHEWYINVALGKSIASDPVLIGISNYLQGLLSHNVSFGKSGGEGHSSRSSLLKVLRDGGILVKYHVSTILPEIFNLLILQNHDAVFGEVHESLPEDSDWLEGLALRLLILERIAAAWSTLLRRCVYHIFETPGHIPASAPYAKLCFDDLAQKLSLSSSKEILGMFNSQLLFTWFSSKQTFASIPYSIFGYANLKNLLSELQTELAAQLFMNEDEDTIASLAEELQTLPEDLLNLSFPRTLAYCIARDLSLPPSSQSSSENQGRPGGSENLLRKYIDKTQYPERIMQTLSVTIFTIVNSIEHEEQLEKAFQKHKDQEASRQALIDMKHRGSNVIPPANQQPSFRAKYILDELLHLCRRSGKSFDELWDPSIVVFIIRKLIGSVHPSLGSLHACSVIRKIRLLVALAGPAVLQGYPLEMLLHALRPFLTDPQCADDTFGIVQYLLEKGLDYLLDHTSFVIGILLAILISLRSFMNSTQSTTTQESDHRATMSRAQSFHKWLVSYLGVYKPSGTSKLSEDAFSAMIKAAQDIKSDGNATLGTDESTLLQELLEEQVAGRHLIGEPAQALILSLLCESFTPPSTHQDDIFGSDLVSSRYAVALWKTCEQTTRPNGYLLWAARSLGRAYASTGTVPKAMVSESTLLDLQSKHREGCDEFARSRSSLFQLLLGFLFSQNPDEARIIEETLQRMLVSYNIAGRMEEIEEDVPDSVLKSVRYSYGVGAVNGSFKGPTGPTLLETVRTLDQKPALSDWVVDFSVAICRLSPSDPLLQPLLDPVRHIPGFAEKAFPFVVHYILLSQFLKDQAASREISSVLSRLFGVSKSHSHEHVRLVIDTILYLRSQPQPKEDNNADREEWLSIDYGEAAVAALNCNMIKTALLFFELRYSQDQKLSKRQSTQRGSVPKDLLSSIYTKIDEPDSFYGVQNYSSLTSVFQQAQHEGNGPKALSLQSAMVDASSRSGRDDQKSNTDGLVTAFKLMGINSVSLSLLKSSQHSQTTSLGDTLYCSARKLERWDLPVSPSSTREEATLFRAFRAINTSTIFQIRESIEEVMLDTITKMTRDDTARANIASSMRTLAVVAEIDELVCASSSVDLKTVWSRMEQRQQWMPAGDFESVSQLLSGREALFSSLARRETLQSIVNCSEREAREFEIRNLLQVSRMSRQHGSIQHALTSTAYLSDLVKPSQELGLDIEPLVMDEMASVLWDQNDSAASIQMLKMLRKAPKTEKPHFMVERSEMLTKLGYRISEARMERPDSVIKHYLLPAIENLQGASQGTVAGKVFHTFALFCDQQLHNPDNVSDLDRLKKLRQRKEEEIAELDAMLKSNHPNKSSLAAHRAKALQWFTLDDREYTRLVNNRNTFLKRSLENYLKSLRACNEYDHDSLRFCALWLENSSDLAANETVSSIVEFVPSRKFVPLINQLSSRLLDHSDKFSSLLMALVARLCTDHPFHGMYQVFANSQSRAKDEISLSRKKATAKVIDRLKKGRGNIWQSIDTICHQYIKLANEKLDSKYRQANTKMPLRKLQNGPRFEKELERSKVPPPTMHIPIAVTCDYTDIPVISKISQEVAIATGISMPKIFSIQASDGRRFKQLVKGGSDDLRQDTIMEQVFEQVSQLLQNDRATRQRNLRIRTYKVMPLSSQAGIIEFVPNTIPLSDYLIPAHVKHFPRDWKAGQCRKTLSDVQSKPLDSRLRAYRQVTEHFHPVLRYFFFDHFDDPNEWFEKRTAYSRSTAAISILGYVLGLGDRHGHNILLDEQTGEVVHIDLGVAFEQGRVLPVPEVVPFRLTRDIVDGMGVTATEGVFRRCCELILTALRNESDNIMTVLDVLRYDPLYSWTVSPVRAKRMQEAQSNNVDQQQTEADAEGGAKQARKKAALTDEPNEADRALTVVKKKLSKGLSVAATVNELIQQATDERNLAVLFPGWAAYA